MITTIRGTRFHYIDRGEGTPLLWIHGYPLSSAMFERQFSIGGVRHIAPDLPGFGESDSAGIATIDEYAGLLVSLLGGIPVRRFVLAGFSMGGYVALAMARLVPERIAGLVLIDTRETPDSPEGRTGRYESIENVKKNGTRPVIDAMLPKLLSARTPNDPVVVSQTMSIMETASEIGVIEALKVMAERPDATETLRSINAPVLVVVGEHDAITPQADAERMVELARNARLVVIADAGHLSNLEQPEAFNAAMAAFLTEDLDVEAPLG
jgi:3-oxoadipate enol-lactonase